LHHVIGLQLNIVVPESQHSITGRFQIASALRFVRYLFLMLTAINLDHQPVFQGNEINYVWA